MNTRGGIVCVWVILLLQTFCARSQQALEQPPAGFIPGDGVDIRLLDPLFWDRPLTTSGLQAKIFTSTSLSKTQSQTPQLEVDYYFINTAQEFEQQLLKSDTLSHLYSSKQSRGYNYYMDSPRKDELLYVYALSEKPLFTLKLGASDFNEKFIDAVKRLGRDITAQGLIHQFGTHYITQVVYGGRFLIRHTIVQEDFKYSPYDKEEFLKTVQSIIPLVQKTQSNPNPYITLGPAQNYTVGGSENLTWIDTWEPTVDERPKPISAQYASIATLLNASNFPAIDSISQKRKMLQDAIDEKIYIAKKALQNPEDTNFYQKYSLEFRQQVHTIIKRSTGKNHQNDTPYAGDIFMGGFTTESDVIKTLPLIENGGVDLETLITDDEVQVDKLLDLLVAPDDLKNGFVSVWDDTKKLVKGEDRTTLFVNGTADAKAYFKDALVNVINKTVQIETIDKDVFVVNYTLEHLRDKATLNLTSPSYNSVMDSELVFAAASGDIPKLQELFDKGGRRSANGIVKAVIQNQDSTAVLNTVLDAGVKPSTEDLDILFDPENFDRDMALVLLERGAKPKNNMIYKAVAYREPEVVYALLREGAVPVNNDLDFAVSLQDYKLVKALMSQDYTDFQAGKAELALAVANNDLELVDQFIAYGADADARIFEMATQQQDNRIIQQVMDVTEANSEALEVAARANKIEYFEYFIKQDAKLLNNKPIEFAIDNNNPEIVKIALQHGGDPTEALDYAIDKDNKSAVEVSLQNKAQPDRAFAYAAKLNDTKLFDEVLIEFGGNPDEALKAAVESDKIELAKRVIKEKPQQLNTTSQLSTAVRNENLEMVSALVENGATPTIGIEEAIKVANYDISKYLIDRGAEARDPKLIQQAVTRKNLQLTSLLLEEGEADPNAALATAIAVDDAAIIQKLLEYEAVIDEASVITAIDKASEDVALLLVKKLPAATDEMMKKASRRGMANVVTNLLDAHIDPQVGVLPAILYKHPIILKQLLIAGAKIDADLFKRAIDYNFVQGVEVLVDFGADPNFTYDNNDTILHQVVRTYQDTDLEMLALFINYGVNVNAKNDRGETPLHIAARGSAINLPIIEYLIDNGALLEAKTDANKTALDYANEKEVKSFLRKSERSR